MLKNDFIVSWRTIRRDKLHTGIIIAGLTIGFAVFILSFLFSSLVINGDKIHYGSDRIYCLNQVKTAMNREEIHTAITPAPLMETLRAEFPEIEEAVRFFPAGRKVVRHDDRKFYVGDIIFADPDFLRFFQNEMVYGDKETALADPASVVLTRENAERYFGEADPSGKILKMGGDLELQVTGVVEEPSNFTGLRYGFVVSMSTARSAHPWMDDWAKDSVMTFVRLSPRGDPSATDRALQPFLDKHLSGREDSPRRLYLFPLADLKFKTRNIASYWAKEPIVPYYSFYFMGLFLLAIACINFTNISTTRFARRAREIGVRKVVGARRSQIALSFVRESVFMAFLALPFGIVLFEYLIRPAFLAFYENEYVFSLWEHPGFILGLVVLTLAVGVLSGFYPAAVLSNLKPVRVIKEKHATHLKKSGFKKSLIVLQFVFASILIVFGFIVQSQHRHLMDLDLGYERTNIAYVPLPEEARERAALIADEALALPAILQSALASGLPSRWNNERQVLPEGSLPGEYVRMNVYPVGQDFTRLFGINVFSGRDFSKDFSEESNIIISESAARKLGWENPLGRRLNVGGTEGTIIGVAEEFYLGETFREKLPCLLIHRKDAAAYAFFQWAGNAEVATVLDDLRSLWNRHQSEIPFTYGTMSELNERINRGFEKGYLVTLAIGLLTVITSAFGLFGLAAFTVQNRTKEIGIRKALGDSVGGIMNRFLRVFLRLVVIANLIAWPLTYFMAKKFILFMNPDFPGSIGLAAYVLTAAITFGTAVAAVSYQVFKAGRINPAETLRYE